jgi:ubiquinone/menaquinone biosynthesis C-methylase UbiE
MTKQSGWQLASGSVAEAYERYLMATFCSAFAQEFVEVASPRAGERVLDVACGTGAAARFAAPFVGPTGSVVGLDLNAGMISMARAIPQHEGAAIEWREGDAASLPFPDASFDLVCCHQGLQFFPDRRAALREMRRVLVPSGRLALGVWRHLKHQPFYSALIEALERFVNLETAASLRAAFTLWNPADLRALLSAAGFQDVHIRIRSRLTRYSSLEEFVPGYLSGTPMAGPVAALDESTRAAMIRYVCTLLESYVDDDGMAAPWESHLVTAHV